MMLVNSLFDPHFFIAKLSIFKNMIKYLMQNLHYVCQLLLISFMLINKQYLSNANIKTSSDIHF